MIFDCCDESVFNRGERVLQRQYRISPLRVLIFRRAITRHNFRNIRRAFGKSNGSHCVFVDEELAICASSSII